eukprot:UN00863
MGDAEIERLKQDFNKKIFTMDEVSKHNTEESPFIVVYGAVYDMTDFQMDHPGGPDVIQDISGLDATEEFENILHTEKARKMGHKYMKGSIEGADFEKWLENMNTAKKKDINEGGTNYIMYIVILLAILVSFYYYYYQPEQ